MLPKDLHNTPPSPKGGGEQAGSTDCAAWAALLPDFVEDLLSPAEQQALLLHLKGCAPCSAELAEAQRGLAWLSLLRDQAPEPPRDMLANILAMTTGLAEAGVYLPERSPVIAPASSPRAEWIVPGGQGLFGAGWRAELEARWVALMQPRLAMTAAMAFFSVCVTLNLLGVSMTQPEASHPAGGLHRTVADTGATLLRSFQGLRVVYRVEARVSEMTGSALTAE